MLLAKVPRILAVCCLAMLAAAAVGCAQGRSIPKNWPVANFNLPAGSAIHSTVQGGFAIRFDCPLSGEDVRKHFDVLLEQKGYLRAPHVTEFMYIYVRSDGLVTVTLYLNKEVSEMYFSDRKDTIPLEFDYMISARVWTTPTPELEMAEPIKINQL